MDAWGMSMGIDLEGCNLSCITSPTHIRVYVDSICALMEVKKFGDCRIVHFGDGETEGYTMVQLIETSMISGHFANKSRTAFIDIFSCLRYDHKKLYEFTKNFFDAEKGTYFYNYRGQK